MHSRNGSDDDCNLVTCTCLSRNSLFTLDVSVCLLRAKVASAVLLFTEGSQEEHFKEMENNSGRD